MLERIIPVVRFTPPKPQYSHKTGKLIEETAVLVLSDSHTGEIVRPDEVLGFNAYNFRIFKNRIKYIAKKVPFLLNQCMRGYSYKKLKILLLGDMVSGEIHDDLRVTNEGGPMEWIYCSAMVFAEFVCELLHSFEHIEIEGVIGNHGRTTQKKQAKRKYQNYDYMLYLTLMLLLNRNPEIAKRVSFQFPQSFFHLTEIEGHTCLLLHGDNIQMYRSIPWYGIMRAVAQFQQMIGSTGKYIEYIFLGHFHNGGALDQIKGEMFLNGSLKGMDEFSIGNLYLTPEPRQNLICFHRDRATWRLPLSLAAAPDYGKDGYLPDIDSLEESVDYVKYLTSA